MRGIPNYMYIHFKNTEALAPTVLSSALLFNASIVTSSLFLFAFKYLTHHMSFFFCYLFVLQSTSSAHPDRVDIDGDQRQQLPKDPELKQCHLFCHQLTSHNSFGNQVRSDKLSIIVTLLTEKPCSTVACPWLKSRTTCHSCFMSPLFP